MKITFFITTLGGGGAERVVSNLANYLVNNNHSVSIIVLRGLDTKYYLDPRVSTIFVCNYYDSNVSSLYRHLKEITISRRILKNLDSDGCLVSFLELPMAISLLFRSDIPCKLIFSERNNPDNYSKIYRYIFRHFSNRADGAVFQTSVVQDWYNTFRNKKVVIPNAINDVFLEAPYAHGGGNKIVTVGRLNSQKNQKLLIESFAIVSRDYPQYRLFIYGDGPLKSELQLLVKNLGIADKVVFTGFKNDIITELMDADLFVLSSDFEGVPNALMEAMALGLPCISTDCAGGGARMLIDDEINGLLVPVGDPKSLSKKMGSVLVDKQLSIKLGENAVLVRETYAPQEIYSRWECYIEDIATL